MKKKLLFVITVKIFAQNLQLQSDIGEDRKYFTTTIEFLNKTGKENERVF